MAVMLTAIMLLFTIPAMGLAIDAGVMYVIRGRLTAACDAASLATARNLNMGLTLEEQTVAATARGTAFFTANFPSGYLGTSGTVPVIGVAQTNLSTLTVTTTATTNAPLYFMRILGGTTAVAGAVGKASRRDVNMMIVLDRSGSMSGTPCTSMKTAATTFVNMFVNGRDTLGLVTYNGSVYLAYPPTVNFRVAGSLLTDAIAAIRCSGATNASDSYMTAYNQLVTLNEPLALNLIVFFTDGMPTAFAATFPIKTVSDTRYGGTSFSCGTGSQCAIPQSTCTDDSGLTSTTAGWGTFAGKTAVIAAATPVTSTTGNTLGLLTRNVSDSTSGDTMASAALLTGCAVATSWTRVRQDVAYIPNTDINGLSTSGYQSVTQFASSHAAYPDKKRPDFPLNITRVAMNLADNAAATARANTTINPVTYTIGLGGNGGVDEGLLKRMANDPGSAVHDATKTDGLYVYAPNSSDLNQAFARIASEILRLAQ
ncbi:MAG: VWA domain-containing protein [Bryobacterales bacterium]|nr:VWA domain-containing protein [Bryobacterales bacterium]